MNEITDFTTHTSFVYCVPSLSMRETETRAFCQCHEAI